MAMIRLSLSPESVSFLAELLDETQFAVVGDYVRELVPGVNSFALETVLRDALAEQASE